MTKFAPRLPMPGFLEVEIGAYCNRRCAWCPNGWQERGQSRASMAPTVWRALLEDLAAERFRGWFAFHNYNEPLADPELLPRIGDVRAALPGAKLELHSNGDFLDEAMLEALVGAGVSVLRVTLYPSEAEAMEPPKPRRIGQFLQRLNQVRVIAPLEKTTKLEQTFEVGGLQLIVRVPRIERYHDRAGAAPFQPISGRGPRAAPCLLPFHSAAIDFHGNLKLCCHVYDSTSRESRPYVLGNVAEVPFSQLWRGERMQALRLQLANKDFSGLSACAQCAHQTPEWIVKKATPLLRQAQRATPPDTKESGLSPAGVSAPRRSMR